MQVKLAFTKLVTTVSQLFYEYVTRSGKTGQIPYNIKIK